MFFPFCRIFAAVFLFCQWHRSPSIAAHSLLWPPRLAPSPRLPPYKCFSRCLTYSCPLAASSNTGMDFRLICFPPLFLLLHFLSADTLNCFFVAQCRAILFPATQKSLRPVSAASFPCEPILFFLQEQKKLPHQGGDYINNTSLSTVLQDKKLTIIFYKFSHLKPLKNGDIIRSIFQETFSQKGIIFLFFSLQ